MPSMTIKEKRNVGRSKINCPSPLKSQMSNSIQTKSADSMNLCNINYPNFPHEIMVCLFTQHRLFALASHIPYNSTCAATNEPNASVYLNSEWHPTIYSLGFICFNSPMSVWPYYILIKSCIRRRFVDINGWKAPTNRKRCEYCLRQNDASVSY